jgi:hypothetical protein
MTRIKGLFLVSATALFCAMALDAAGAGDIDGHKIVSGLSVYLGITPAAAIQAHPGAHKEAAMHGGPLRGRHVHHLTAALFDSRTGDRVEVATIDARVAPLGLAGEARRLEPMEIAGTVTYGNYFALRGNEAYRITLSIWREGRRQPVTVEFTHRHRNR